MVDIACSYNINHSVTISTILRTEQDDEHVESTVSVMSKIIHSMEKVMEEMEKLRVYIHRISISVVSPLSLMLI